MTAQDGTPVVRRNTEEVQGRGNFEVFDELFVADFVDHTAATGRPYPGSATARETYTAYCAPHFRCQKSGNAARSTHMSRAPSASKPPRLGV